VKEDAVLNKYRTLIGSILVVVSLAAGWTAYAQVTRPYRTGSAWDIAFIRMKPGMETAYLNYIGTDWKREQEALKKEGLIISYRVISTEPHNPGDFNLLLMTEYKNLAALEAAESKIDAVGQKLWGSDAKIQQGYKERLEIREVLGNRLGREIVLEPRQ
jgi:hypothetical protein